MKTLNLSTGAVILGALSASFAACSASSESTAPRGTAGTTGAAGATGSGGATSTAAGATGFAGATTGVAGAGVATAGASGVGTAGATGVGTGGATGATGASGAAGAATGAAGAAAMSCGTLTPVTGDPMCCVAAGTAADLPIDNLEDGDNAIMPIGQRQGYWYSYGTDPTQVPLPTSFGGKTLVPVAPGNTMTGGSPLFAVLTSGSVPANMINATTPSLSVNNQAGIGVGFNNHFNKSCPYNASAYKGITFWAKGPGALKVQISIPATVPASATVAGTCTSTTGCYDSYATIIAAPPSGWKQFAITFADKTNFAQSGYGTAVAFDPSMIMDLQFQVDGVATGATPYNFGIDDVSFFTVAPAL